ncbi:hypothetical protein [Brachybacterium sp. UNK5269]|uniref:hypothetical protein n=1 Tax=Brachybacterium sp. UNK5269 TaxID=3408576 RepID=UPI003BB1E244
MLEHLRVSHPKIALDQAGPGAEAHRVVGPRDDDPERIAATTGGAGFRLADCVDLLCRSVLELAA